MQLTPHGAAASIQFGIGSIDAAAGSVRGLYLVVRDIDTARRELLGRGVAVSEIRHKDTEGSWRGGFLPVWTRTGLTMPASPISPTRRQHVDAAGAWQPSVGANRTTKRKGLIMDTATRQDEQAGIERPHPGEAYDVIVLGAGPVGQNVAARARAAGLTVAVIERELVGGECSYWGCVPSKALLRPVIAVADARRVDGAREAVSDPVSAPSVFGRRDRYVTLWETPDKPAASRKSAPTSFADTQIDGPQRVVVTTADDELLVLSARHAVAICTGSSAALPDIPGIAEARPWTNRKATDSAEVPARLAVVGAGGVGVEMATAWQGLGAHITLLARGRGLLPRMEPFVGELSPAGSPMPVSTCAPVSPSPNCADPSAPDR